VLKTISPGVNLQSFLSKNMLKKITLGWNKHMRKNRLHKNSHNFFSLKPKFVVALTALLILSFLSTAVATLSPLSATSSSVQTPTIIWKTNLNPPQSAHTLLSWYQPTVVDGIIYVGANYGIYDPTSTYNPFFPQPGQTPPPYIPENHWSYFYAFDASNGDLIWKYRDPDGETMFLGPCVVAEGKVFFSRGVYFNCTLTALNVANGDFLWKANIDGENSAPVVANGGVYVAGYVFDENTGNVISRQQPTNNGIAYLTPLNDTVIALDTNRGKQLWSFNTTSKPASVVNSEGRVYFAAGTDIYALNAATGAKIWNYTTPHTWLYPNLGDAFTTEFMSPTIQNGVVYIFSTRAQCMLALKASNGELLWNFSNAGGDSSDVGGHPTVVDGVVYVYLNGAFCGLNAYSGDKIWEYPICPEDFPAVANNVAYYCLEDLYALKLPDYSLKPNSQTVVTVYTDNKQLINFTISGSIASSQISNAYYTTDPNKKTATLYLTVTGPSGEMGDCNITIPRSLIPSGTAPEVNIGDKSAVQQGFTQDSDNYYVWFSTHFSTNSVAIMFSAQNSGTPSVSILFLAIILVVLVLSASLLIYFKKRKNPESKHSV
jgi:outer membrane protein assembly factor BamB